MSFLIFGVVFLLALAGFAMFDVINRYQYRNLFEEWEKAGKAGGFFWYPRESTLFTGTLQRSVRFLSWTLGSEEWMRNDATIRRIALIMRVCNFLTWALIIPFAIFTLQK